MTDQLDTAAIRARSQQPGYQEGQALQDVMTLCDAQDKLCDHLSVQQENIRETFEAMVAMRDSINEHLPMPSLESDLAQGPDDRVFCSVVAEAVIGELDRLRAENERLREALRPFATAADDYCDPTYDDDYSPRWAEFFVVRDFRRARAALAKGGEDTPRADGKDG